MNDSMNYSLGYLLPPSGSFSFLFRVLFYKKIISDLHITKNINIHLKPINLMALFMQL